MVGYRKKSGYETTCISGVAILRNVTKCVLTNLQKKIDEDLQRNKKSVIQFKIASRFRKQFLYKTYPFICQAFVFVNALNPWCDNVAPKPECFLPAHGNPAVTRSQQFQ